MARSRYWGKNAHLAKAAEKELRKIHPLTFLIPVIFLIVGLVIGYVGMSVFCKNDSFVLTGEKSFTVTVGESFSYKEEGFTCIALGRDLSSAVKIETNMTKNADGSYTVDTSEAGIYYISYTCEEGIYSGVRLVRTLRVTESEVAA